MATLDLHGVSSFCKFPLGNKHYIGIEDTGEQSLTMEMYFA